jgi:predicted XRE-type DNA-binding protein
MTNRVLDADNCVTHVTTGDVLDDLGFSPEQLPALKLRSDALNCILDEVAAKGYTARQLETLLDEYQPQVSNLVRGKIAKLSLEKLLYYCSRLNIQITTKFKPAVQSAKMPVKVTVKPTPRGWFPLGVSGMGSAARSRMSYACKTTQGLAVAKKRAGKLTRTAARSK